METNPELETPLAATEAVEEDVFALLSNEPSNYIEIPRRGIKVVFKRPSMTEKFRQRVWASKKLRSFGIVNQDQDDPNVSFFFRYWGTLNAFITKIIVEDKKGSISSGGKKYREYLYNPEEDVDYGSVFEKYTMEEVFNPGMSEEAFVSEVIVEHAKWMDDSSRVKEDDIKNS